MIPFQFTAPGDVCGPRDNSFQNRSILDRNRLPSQHKISIQNGGFPYVHYTNLPSSTPITAACVCRLDPRNRRPPMPSKKRTPS